MSVNFWEMMKPVTGFFENIQPMNFVTNLKYMGIGMLGIFIVIGVIILLTMLLNTVTTRKKEQ